MVNFGNQSLVALGFRMGLIVLGKILEFRPVFGSGAIKALEKTWVETRVSTLNFTVFRMKKEPHNFCNFWTIF